MQEGGASGWVHPGRSGLPTAALRLQLWAVTHSHEASSHQFSENRETRGSLHRKLGPLRLKPRALFQQEVGLVSSC